MRDNSGMDRVSERAEIVFATQSRLGMDDECCSQLVTYLKDGSYPSTFNKNQKQLIRQQAQSFEEKDGTLLSCIGWKGVLCCSEQVRKREINAGLS